MILTKKLKRIVASKEERLVDNLFNEINKAVNEFDSNFYIRSILKSITNIKNADFKSFIEPSNLINEIYIDTDKFAEYAMEKIIYESVENEENANTLSQNIETSLIEYVKKALTLAITVKIFPIILDRLYELEQNEVIINIEKYIKNEIEIAINDLAKIRNILVQRMGAMFTKIY